MNILDKVWQSSTVWSQNDLQTIISSFDLFISTYPHLSNATNSYQALVIQSRFSWLFFINFIDYNYLEKDKNLKRMAKSQSVGMNGKWPFVNNKKNPSLK